MSLPTERAIYRTAIRLTGGKKWKALKPTKIVKDIVRVLNAPINNDKDLSLAWSATRLLPLLVCESARAKHFLAAIERENVMNAIENLFITSHPAESWFPHALKFFELLLKYDSDKRLWSAMINETNLLIMDRALDRDYQRHVPLTYGIISKLFDHDPEAVSDILAEQEVIASVLECALSTDDSKIQRKGLAIAAKIAHRRDVSSAIDDEEIVDFLIQTVSECEDVLIVYEGLKFMAMAVVGSCSLSIRSSGKLAVAVVEFLDRDDVNFVDVAAVACDIMWSGRRVMRSILAEACFRRRSIIERLLETRSDNHAAERLLRNVNAYCNGFDPNRLSSVPASTLPPC